MNALDKANLYVRNRNLEIGKEISERKRNKTQMVSSVKSDIPVEDMKRINAEIQKLLKENQYADKRAFKSKEQIESEVFNQYREGKL